MKKTVSKKDIISFAVVITVLALMGAAIYLCTTAELNRKSAADRIKSIIAGYEDLRKGNRTICFGIEESRPYRISDSETILVAKETVPDTVIKSAKNFIEKSGIDSKKFGFIFCNSKYDFTLKEVIEDQIYYYNPNPMPDYQAEKYGDIYYVEMVYYAGFAQVSVGYFAIDESGELVESKYIRPSDEVSKYKMNPHIDEYEAVEIANEKMSDDSGYVGKIFFNYNIEDTGVLCYSVEFDDGSKVYVNGVTGKIEEIYKALDNATPKGYIAYPF